MITADFECITKPIWEERGKKMVRYQKHPPSGFWLHISRFDGKNKYYSHTGSNASAVFTETLDKIVHDWYEEFKTSTPVIDSEKANEAARAATHCWVCKKQLGGGL